MRLLLLATLLFTGCSIQFDPFKRAEQNQDIIKSINALNEFAVQVDERIKKLEPKK